MMTRKPSPSETRLDRTDGISDWKRHIHRVAGGWFELDPSVTPSVSVRIFLTDTLLAQAEPSLFQQVLAATRFQGTRCVVITPDAHYGYGVPVGCVIATDAEAGALALGPVGFDIGCGMISAQSTVPATSATQRKRLEFNREVMSRIALGTGGASRILGNLDVPDFMHLMRGGAHAYAERFQTGVDRTRTERQAFPVDEDWEPPWSGRGVPERGLHQLGTLGGGNHFIELQRGVEPDQDPRDERSGRLFVQIHTGSRGFGHGLATNYFDFARTERPDLGANIDLGFFLPDSPHYRGYLNAVGAGANFAIINRLIIFEQVAESFRKVFGEDLQLVYELSHNLVQREMHPEFGLVWVHRKGATRAFPARHPSLVATPFHDTGHPVLVPGSNHDESFILRPLANAVSSLYSLNHGAGRRISRGEAMRSLDQQKVNDSYRRAKVLVNDDGPVPLDESAACYKRSHEVLQAIIDPGLAEIQVRLWPLSSIKGDDSGASAEKRARRRSDRDRQRQRDLARRSKG